MWELRHRICDVINTWSCWHQARDKTRHIYCSNTQQNMKQVSLLLKPTLFLRFQHFQVETLSMTTEKICWQRFEPDLSGACHHEVLCVPFNSRCVTSGFRCDVNVRWTRQGKLSWNKRQLRVKSFNVLSCRIWSILIKILVKNICLTERFSTRVFSRFKIRCQFSFCWTVSRCVEKRIKYQRQKPKQFQLFFD